ncbi:MAG TPA: TRAP transporter large permease [Candidatus Bathyarchaeia archaeon]|nr:TRAP transporter large permease [Candidatus Bathyarchaeia archaeon]
MILVTVLFLALLVVGAPVAVAVGAAGFVGAILASPAPLAITVQQMFHQVDSFVLLAFPLFVLAGALMETGGIARRLVDLAVALVGWVRGGLGMAVVIAEYIFSGISGSTVADVSAVASTTIPSMVRAGYSRELAVAIVSAASAMGILVPPCILMIVIGSIAGLSVAALFTAGFIPAVILAIAIMIYIYRLAGRGGIEAAARPSGGEVGRAFVHALIPLGMPAIIFGGILGGIMTPTEASVVAVLYAAVVGLFIYREISWSQLPEILIQSAAVTGAVGLLLATAGVISWFLTVQQLPTMLIRIMTIVPGSSFVFLLITAVVFIFFGAVVEGLPAVVILLPSLLPVATQLAIDPIHYAIVIVAAVGIGLFLPPVGVGLFIACGIAGVSVDRATRAVLPFIVVLCVGLVVIIVAPWFTLVLPRIFKLL